MPLQIYYKYGSYGIIEKFDQIYEPGQVHYPPHQPVWENVFTFARNMLPLLVY